MSRSPPKKRRTAQFATSDAQISDIALPPPSERMRPSSPPRELRDIYKYTKPPLKFATSPNETTPACILELYQRLHQFAVGIIPQELKPRMRNSSIPNSARDSIRILFNLTPNPDSEALLGLVKKILRKAQEAFEGNEPEGSWIKIASDMLEGVLESPGRSGMLRVMDVQYSDINSTTLLPTINNVAIPVKKADLILAIYNSHPSTRDVYDYVRAVNPTLRLGQMSEASVAWLALPVCVEVGEPCKSYTEASVQLGVWCCAGLLKLQELRKQFGWEGGADNAILPLFGWTAVGMDWKLHTKYSEPRNGEVYILGPLNSGGVGDTHAFFILVKVITFLEIWTASTFWPSFIDIVQDPEISGKASAFFSSPVVQQSVHQLTST